MGKAPKRNFGSMSKQYSDSVRNKDGYNSVASKPSAVFNQKMMNDKAIFNMDYDKSYCLRIVPYEVDSTHPKVQEGMLDDGDMAFVLDYNVHFSIGPDKTTVVCPKGTYGKACPVCEKWSEMFDEANGDKNEEAKARTLSSSRRVMYNVVDINHPEKGVQLLMESQFAFGKELLNALESEKLDILHVCAGVPAKSLPGEEKKPQYLRVSVKEANSGKGKKRKEFRFVFKNCKEEDLEHDEEILEQATQLHKLLQVKTYDELSDVLYGANSAHDDDDDDDDDDDVRRPVNSSKAKGKSSRRDDDDEDEDERPSRSSRRDDDDDEDEKPSKSNRRDDDEDEKPSRSRDDDDDDDDEKSSKSECPNDFEFGKDYLKHDECEGCPDEDACLKYKKELRNNR